MSEEKELEIPSKGDKVKITYVGEGSLNYNSDSFQKGDTFAEGNVKRVDKYDTKDDNSVYIEIYKEKDNIVMFKYGYFKNEKYSWIILSNYGGPEIKLDKQDCFEYEII